MNLLIRRMTLDDWEQVVAIDQMSFPLPWPPHSFRYELTDNPAARCWVAESDGRVIAMLVGWLMADEFHVATIATHPEVRGRGVGKRLLLHALKSAREEGAARSFLEVRASNEIAQNLYRRFGYRVTGRRREYYKDNREDAVLMTLENLDRLPGE